MFENRLSYGQDAPVTGRLAARGLSCPPGRPDRRPARISRGGGRCPAGGRVGCLHRASSHAADFAAKDTLAGTSAPGRGGSLRGPGGSGQPQLRRPSQDTRVGSGPHLAVEVKALLGALTGWGNAVVMPPRCDVCPRILPGRWGRAWLSRRGPAAAAVADDCGRRPRMSPGGCRPASATAVQARYAPWAGTPRASRAEFAA